MLRRSLITLAIVSLVTFSTPAFAGNNKTEAGSGINPAETSEKPGFDNGNAWWKNNECIEIVDSLEAYIDELVNEVNTLTTENEALKAEIASLKVESHFASVSYAANEVPAEMDAIRFALQKSSEDHPNHPGVVGIYLNMFSYDEFLTEQIMNTSSGEYEVHVTVTTPDGDVLNASSFINAQEAPKAGRDHWVGLIY